MAGGVRICIQGPWIFGSLNCHHNFPQRLTAFRTADYAFDCAQFSRSRIRLPGLDLNVLCSRHRCECKPQQGKGGKVHEALFQRHGCTFGRQGWILNRDNNPRRVVAGA